ncbi:MAG: glutathione S-transferase family protein [Myxococcota bacterium]|nr:glutathione S-transferase family protein [Myxococcota bacterium]
MPKIHGVPPSPFVRKVRVFCAEKGIAYDLELVMPFPPANATPEFRAMSPLGKVPAWEEEGFAISDSSVICDYLERCNPDPPLYPTDARERARALWFEELADSKLADACGQIFFNRVIKPRIMQQPCDDALVEEARTELLPPLLDYLEAQLGDAEYLVGDRFTIADLAVGTQLQQLRHAEEPLDATRWPKLVAWAERVHGRPSFKDCFAGEQQMFATS